MKNAGNKKKIKFRREKNVPEEKGRREERSKERGERKFLVKKWVSNEPHDVE